MTNQTETSDRLPDEPETFTAQHDEALWACRMGNISLEEYYRRADALLDGKGE